MSENQNQTLKKLVTKLTQAKATSNISLDGWDPRTRTSAAIAKREAADSLEVLKTEYRDQVSTRVVKVFIYGDPQRVKDMSDYLDSKGAVVVDGQTVYSVLAKPVESTIDPRARRFDSHQTLRLRQEYFDMAQVLGLSEVPDLKTAQSDYDSLVLTPEATLELTKKIIRRTAGDGLNQLYLVKKIINELLDAEVDSNWVPVIITGCTEEEIGALGLGLFPGQPSLTYKADDVVDFEAVGLELSKKVVKLLDTNKKSPKKAMEEENE